jgi:hypothetical protein
VIDRLYKNFTKKHKRKQEVFLKMLSQKNRELVNESNLNILTDSNPPYERAIGSTPLKGVLCHVSKAQSF